MNLRKAIEISAFLLLFAGLILYRKEVSAGIWDAIGYSLSSLIPSILPFMFLSTLLSKRSVYGIICRIFSLVTTYLFRLPECTGGVILSGLTCGYPVGAKLTSELLKAGEIDEDTARRLLLFCVNPGIPFTVLFLGGEIFGSLKIGMFLYFSVLLSNFLAGFLLSCGHKIPQKEKPKQKRSDFSAAMKASADSTVRACLNMAVYIIIFRGLFALLHAAGVYQAIVGLAPVNFQRDTAVILSFILEVTAGITDAVALKAELHLFAFGLGFGGICIILQLVSFFDNFRQNFLEIAISRLFSAIFSGLFFSQFQRFLPAFQESIPVFSSIEHPIPAGLEASPEGFVCLLMLFGVYILSGHKLRVEKRQKKC